MAHQTSLETDVSKLVNSLKDLERDIDEISKCRPGTASLTSSGSSDHSEFSTPRESGHLHAADSAIFSGASDRSSSSKSMTGSSPSQSNRHTLDSSTSRSSETLSRSSEECTEVGEPINLQFPDGYQLNQAYIEDHSARAYKPRFTGYYLGRVSATMRDPDAHRFLPPPNHTATESRPVHVLFPFLPSPQDSNIKPSMVRSQQPSSASPIRRRSDPKNPPQQQQQQQQLLVQPINSSGGASPVRRRSDPKNQPQHRNGFVSTSYRPSPRTPFTSTAMKKEREHANDSSHPPLNAATAPVPAPVPAPPLLLASSSTATTAFSFLKQPRPPPAVANITVPPSKPVVPLPLSPPPSPAVDAKRQALWQHCLSPRNKPPPVPKPPAAILDILAAEPRTPLHKPQLQPFNSATAVIVTPKYLQNCSTTALLKVVPVLPKLATVKIPEVAPPAPYNVQKSPRRMPLTAAPTPPTPSAAAAARVPAVLLPLPLNLPPPPSAPPPPPKPAADSSFDDGRPPTPSQSSALLMALPMSRSPRSVAMAPIPPVPPAPHALRKSPRTTAVVPPLSPVRIQPWSLGRPSPSAIQAANRVPEHIPPSTRDSPLPVRKQLHANGNSSHSIDTRLSPTRARPPPLLTRSADDVPAQQLRKLPPPTASLSSDGDVGPEPVLSPRQRYLQFAAVFDAARKGAAQPESNAPQAGWRNGTVYTRIPKK